jgi:hypothetical protein
MRAVLGALIIIGASVSIAVLGLWLSRRHIQAVVPRQNDLSAAVLGVIGTLYGVLLALITITVLERYTTVESLIVSEASHIWDLYRNAAQLPPAVAPVLQQDLRDYVEAVIRDEWPAMRQRRDSARTSDATAQFMRHLTSSEPRTTGETVLLLATIQRADDFLAARRQRLFLGRTQLERLLWIILIVGAVVTVGASYVFWAESPAVHGLLTAALAALIGLTLYVIASLDHPLWGSSQSLGPEYFELIRGWMIKGPP